MMSEKMRCNFERDRRTELRLRLAGRRATDSKVALAYGRKLVGQPQEEVVTRLIEKVRRL
jgi:hypothetical protein